MREQDVLPPKHMLLMCHVIFRISNNMHKYIPQMLAFLVLLGLAPLLGACNTTAGVGEDLSAGGHAITNTAERHAP